MGKRRKQDRELPHVSTKLASRPPKRVPEKIPLDVSLKVPRRLFEDTMLELESRSAGWRESAAVWAGSVREGVWQADLVRFHHHLCDDSASALSIELTEEAKLALYEELAALGLRLVALIHTHPKDWVGLSQIDEANQICSRLGFWSLVAPWYGRTPWGTAFIGVHVRCDDGWYQLKPWEVSERVNIEG